MPPITPSGARPGFRTVLGIGDGDTNPSNETFLVLAEILDFPETGTAHRTTEVTNMTSPEGWVEHIALGIKELKPFTLPLNFIADDTDQIELYQNRVANGSKNRYMIQFTDEAKTTLIFSAVVNDTGIAGPRDAQATINVSFLPTSAPIWGTAGTLLD